MGSVLWTGFLEKTFFGLSHENLEISHNSDVCLELYSHSQHAEDIDAALTGFILQWLVI
jgi:hypothetical protein